MTHICVSKLTIIGSDNGLLPGRRQAIIWTNAGILLIGPLGTNFSEIFYPEFKHFLSEKCAWQCRLRLFRLGLNELNAFSSYFVPAFIYKNSQNKVSERWLISYLTCKRLTQVVTHLEFVSTSIYDAHQSHSFLSTGKIVGIPHTGYWNVINNINHGNWPSFTQIASVLTQAERYKEVAVYDTGSIPYSILTWCIRTRTKWQTNLVDHVINAISWLNAFRLRKQIICDIFHLYIDDKQTLDQVNTLINVQKAIALYGIVGHN